MAYQYIEIMRKPLLLTQVLDVETEQRIQAEIMLARRAPELRAALELLLREADRLPDSISGQPQLAHAIAMARFTLA